MVVCRYGFEFAGKFSVLGVWNRAFLSWTRISDRLRRSSEVEKRHDFLCSSFLTSLLLFLRWQVAVRQSAIRVRNWSALRLPPFKEIKCKVSAMLCLHGYCRIAALIMQRVHSVRQILVAHVAVFSYCLEAALIEAYCFLTLSLRHPN